MTRWWRALAALAAAGVTLAACGDAKGPKTGGTAAVPAAPPAQEAASAAAPALHSVTVRGRIRPDGPEMRFVLQADAAPQANGVLQVRAIDIQSLAPDGTAAPLQRIEGLATQTPWTPDTPVLELIDMNFDGHADLRLIESRPAGPNLPYLNWLYEPASGRFAASPALDAINAPRFDAGKREVQSDWRDSAAHYGTDTHSFRDGTLLPLRREARIYKSPGAYTLQISRWTQGAWKLAESRQVREP